MGSTCRVKFVLMHDSIADTAFWVIPSVANIMRKCCVGVIEVPETSYAYPHYRSMAGRMPELFITETN